MRIVLSAVVVALIGVLVYWGWQRVPMARDYSDCYRQAYLVFNQKYMLSRHIYTTEKVMCEQSKVDLDRALECYFKVEQEHVMNPMERSQAEYLGRILARVNYTMEEMVVKHNEQCQFISARLENWEK